MVTQVDEYLPYLFLRRYEMIHISLRGFLNLEVQVQVICTLLYLVYHGLSFFRDVLGLALGQSKGS